MGSIKSKPLEIVERVVRNMPIMGIEYLWEDTPHGRVYIAFGPTVTGTYHGAWAFLEGPGIAQPVEFRKDQTRTSVVKTLFALGREVLEQMAAQPTLLRRG